MKKALERDTRHSRKNCSNTPITLNEALTTIITFRQICPERGRMFIERSGVNKGLGGSGWSWMSMEGHN